MSKKVPYKIAMIMYDLQEHCLAKFWGKEKPCKGCAANKKEECNLYVACRGIPAMWGITKADIERLKREIDG